MLKDFFSLGVVVYIQNSQINQLKEEELWTGSLEPTNEWYALAKITGIKLCMALRKQYNFDAISLMPTNLYGPGDNYHPTNSHVSPALFVDLTKHPKEEIRVLLAGEVVHQ